jgi:hypothetical protein
MITKDDICTAGLKMYFKDHEFHDQPPDSDMVILCRRFIREWLTPAPNCKRPISSYGLKHEVERWAGTYISNGAFIFAALLEGLKQEPTSRFTPNTWVYVKMKYNSYHEQPKLETKELSLNECSEMLKYDA